MELLRDTRKGRGVGKVYSDCIGKWYILVYDMTYLRELPACQTRFGRTDIIENDNKKIARMILACGYREVEPEECIICGGFQNVKLECRVDTFIRVVKHKWYRSKGRDK